MQFLSDTSPERLKDRVAIFRIDLNIDKENMREYATHGTVPFRIEAVLPTIRSIRLLLKSDAKES